jgi:hypothetical protein
MYNASTWRRDELLSFADVPLAALAEAWADGKKTAGQPGFEGIHCVARHTWLGLQFSPSSDKNAGRGTGECGGFLLVSMAVIAADATNVPNLVESPDDADAASTVAGGEAGKSGAPVDPGAVDLSSLVIMPPTLSVEKAQLRVSIRRAEHLRPMDVVNGSIDAFAKLCFGPVSDKSKVVKANLNPTWDAELAVPVSLPSMASECFVQVWDEDVGRANELLASLSLRLDDLPSTPSAPRWYNLYAAHVDAPADFARTVAWGQQDGDAFVGRVLLSAWLEKPTATKGKGKGKKEADGSSSTHVSVPREEPPVGRAMVGLDLLEYSDAPAGTTFYLIASFGPITRRSSTFKAKEGRRAELAECLDVVYNDAPVAEGQAPRCIVSLMEKRTLGADRWVAAATVDLDDKEWRWVYLSREDGSGGGCVLLRSQLVKGSTAIAATESRSPPTRPHSSTFTLRVIAFGGRGLRAADGSGSADPYCVLKCGGQVARSTTQHSLCPEWNEPLHLRNIELPITAAGAIDATFAIAILTLMDADFGLNADDYMGSVSLDLASLGLTPPDAYTSVPEPTWYPLRERTAATGDESLGELLLSVSLYPTEAGSVTKLTHKQLMPPGSTQLLSVDIISVDMLRAVHNLPVSRPFVEFQVGGMKGTYRTGKNGPRPSKAAENLLLESFRIPVHIPTNMVFSPSLSLTVRDDCIVV